MSEDHSYIYAWMWLHEALTFTGQSCLSQGNIYVAYHLGQKSYDNPLPVFVQVCPLWYLVTKPQRTMANITKTINAILAKTAI